MEVIQYWGTSPQAWRKPRGVPILDTQFCFGDEEGGGGDEVVAILSNISLSASLKL